MESKRNAAVAFAPAKLNLHLEVLGKRPDGYHAIETVMVPIDLFDTIEARRTNREIALSIDNASIPADASNLVWKAAALLQETSGTSFGASIRLTKRIPSEAGLGGGSSDAAWTLRLLKELWELHLPIDQLSPLANRLGSDVGFFLHDSAARCTGRGEIIEPIAVAEPLHFVLVKPDIGASTAAVFRQLESSPGRSVSEAREKPRLHVGLASEVSSEPRSRFGLVEDCNLPDLLLQALQQGNLSHIAAHLHNRLQPCAFGLHPEIERVYDCLKGTGALGVCMSGSGSSLFALCKDRADAQQVRQEFDRRISALRISCQSYIVRSLGHMPR